jgi:hypothetical protein
MIFCNLEGEVISEEDLQAYVYPIFDKSSQNDLMELHAHLIELADNLIEKNQELFNKNNLNLRCIRTSYILFLLSVQYHTDTHALLHLFEADDFRIIDSFEKEHEYQLMIIKKRMAKNERLKNTPEH